MEMAGPGAHAADLKWSQLANCTWHDMMICEINQWLNEQYNSEP